ncbi:hypothetical protein [Flavobacterium soyangense]|uniref:Lipoprotein n=1 Tax=Flavobacterium soyangense TaxID=2023265 RepID=A0A930XUY1_9FLAO|nr:hypothetical protein [Flavobacterium soyangense]MBF2709065.1 hypothetical protein [Flavobacterium soyangense]
MRKKFHIILLIVTVGFFLMPSLTIACEMKSGKSCCNTETPNSNIEKKDCYKIANHSKNKEHEDSCNGKCGHSNCTTSSVQFSIAFFEIKFKSNNFDFSEKQQNYFNSETNLSSGFHSIWLIPKIS